MAKRSIRRVFKGLINFVGALALLSIVTSVFYCLCYFISKVTTGIVEVMNKLGVKMFEILTTDYKNIIIIFAIVIIALVLFTVFKEIAFKKAKNSDNKGKAKDQQDEEIPDEIELEE